MSDKRVVFEKDGVRVYENGIYEEQWPDGEWRETLNDEVPAMLARALAESEAKVARLAKENAKLLFMVETAYGADW